MWRPGEAHTASHSVVTLSTSQQRSHPYHQHQKSTSLNAYKTSTAKQVLGNCERMVLIGLKEIGYQPLFYEFGCQLANCTSALLYCDVKLFLNFCCQILSYYFDCQPLHCTCSLLYLCTVHAMSVMNHACVMFCPCLPPIFKIYVSEILYE